MFGQGTRRFLLLERLDRVGGKKKDVGGRKGTDRRSRWMEFLLRLGQQTDALALGARRQRHAPLIHPSNIPSSSAILVILVIDKACKFLVLIHGCFFGAA
ncbi:hypothetical protein AOLI_G00148900 [Acnodon oligacanthus]